MPKTKSQKLVHITHKSIPLFIDNESTVLILGSFPSVKSREDGFYYAHKQNRLFPVLAGIFDESIPKTIDERKAFLRNHNIALYDVIYECDISGSSDASIKNPIVINLKQILIDYPNIKKIGVNGDKAKQLFGKYLLCVLKDFDIRVYFLPSTSPANVRASLDELTSKYREIFLINFYKKYNSIVR